MKILKFFGKLLFILHWYKFCNQVFKHDDALGLILVRDYYSWLSLLWARFQIPNPKGNFPLKKK